MEKIKNSRIEYGGALGLLVIHFILVIVSLRSNPFSHLLNGHDSSMFMYFGKGMSDGLIPYADMFDHKGIVLFWIQYLATLLGGGNLALGVWLMESFFYLVTILFLLKGLMFLTKNVLASSISIVIFTGAIIASFDGGNYSEQFALTFISIGLYLLIRVCLDKPDNKLYLFIIGLMGGLTFFIRSNMIGLWIAFCLFLLIKGITDKKYQLLIKQVMFIFLGGAMVCLLVAIYGVVMGNLSEMIYQTFTLNVQYSSESTFKDKVMAGKSFFEFATRVGIVPFGVLFAYYLINYREKFNEKRYALYVVMVIYFSINFITVIMSGRDYLHYFITMFPAVITMTGLGINGTFASIKGRGRKYLSYGVLFLLPFAYSVNIFQDVTRPILSRTPNENVDSSIVRVAEYIKTRTTKEDPIYVHNINANIYLLSDRYANSKFFNLPSLDYRQFNELRAEFSKSLEQNPPKYIVVRKTTYDNQHNLTDVRLDKTVMEYLSERYKQVSDFENEDFMIFSRK